MKQFILIALGVAATFGGIWLQLRFNEFTIERVVAKAQGEDPPPKCDEYLARRSQDHWFKGEYLLCVEILPGAHAWIVMSR